MKQWLRQKAFTWHHHDLWSSPLQNSRGPEIHSSSWQMGLSISMSSMAAPSDPLELMRSVQDNGMRVGSPAGPSKHWQPRGCRKPGEAQLLLLAPLQFCLDSLIESLPFLKSHWQGNSSLPHLSLTNMSCWHDNYTLLMLPMPVLHHHPMMWDSSLYFNNPLV